jgi:hypothetical protein
MGFEITYSYHEKNEGGGYNTDEVKKASFKIGDPFEDVPLERCAAAIMRQMARRDVWVLPDPEIYELKKIKVSCRETPGGVIIKNKKFNLDHTEGVLSVELTSQPVVEARPQPQYDNSAVDYAPPMPVVRALVPQADPNQLSEAPQENVKKRVMKWVVFEPELPQLHEAKQKGLACTQGNKYPVFSEKEHPMGISFGMVYTILDDKRREIQTSDKYFVPATVRLQNDHNGEFSQPSSNSDNSKLIWPGEVMQEEDVSAVPDVRRMAASGARIAVGGNGMNGGGMDTGMPDIRRARR